MNDCLIRTLGDELYDALRARKTLPPLTDRHPDIGIEDAYHISLHLLSRRERDGERLIGKKIGVTSKAVQDMLNVHQPDFGFLTDARIMPLLYGTQFAVILGAHLLAVVLSFRLAGPVRALAHLPLTVLMVGYTVLGLWLLSTARVG